MKSTKRMKAGEDEGLRSQWRGLSHSVNETKCGQILSPLSFMPFMLFMVKRTPYFRMIRKDLISCPSRDGISHALF